MIALQPYHGINGKTLLFFESFNENSKVSLFAYKMGADGYLPSRVLKSA